MNLKETKEWATKGCANSITILDLITKIEQLQTALEESVKLQSHYANLLNMYDGGLRMQFVNAQVWIDRLKKIKAIKG